ncbi:putative hydroxyisourate hydrolase [Helianthus annuus]|nr:putative hydroxyisourate hydrolase [Helianthus annuus]
MKKNAGSRIPNFTKQESERIKGSFDFVGINHYDTVSIKNNPSSLEMETRDMYADMAATLIGVYWFYDTTFIIGGKMGGLGNKG